MADGDPDRAYRIQFFLVIFLGLGLSLTVPALFGLDVLWHRFVIFLALFVLPTSLMLVRHRRRTGSPLSRSGSNYEKIAVGIGVALAISILAWAAFYLN